MSISECYFKKKSVGLLCKVEKIPSPPALPKKTVVIEVHHTN